MIATIPQPQTAAGRAAGGFPAAPASWFHLCRSHELAGGPLELEFGGKSFVGYRTASGRAAVLAGRCSHLGARLANGAVAGERIVCPLHGWEYGPDGACEKIPAADTIPGFARQCSYPVEECGGQVFFFNEPRARYPFPFFDGATPDQLRPATPFELTAEVPWYFTGANGFDLQHFRMAHDRVFVGEPRITRPSPFARCLTATFEVCGDSWHDRVTRRLAGSHITMSITVWSGGLILVKSAGARMTTYGMMSVQPLDAHRTRGRVIVWLPRRGPGQRWLDPIDACIRRSFIRTFLRSDLPRVAGLRYQPGNLIPADRALAEYFEWLQNISQPSTLDLP